MSGLLVNQPPTDRTDVAAATILAWDFDKTEPREVLYGKKGLNGQEIDFVFLFLKECPLCPQWVDCGRITGECEWLRRGMADLRLNQGEWQSGDRSEPAGPASDPETHHAAGGSRLG